MRIGCIGDDLTSVDNQGIVKIGEQLDEIYQGVI